MNPFVIACIVVQLIALCFIAYGTSQNRKLTLQISLYRKALSDFDIIAKAIPQIETTAELSFWQAEAHSFIGTYWNKLDRNTMALYDAAFDLLFKAIAKRGVSK